MERLLIEELRKWRDKTDRLPLILQGARQVGKTWILKEFGRQCFADVCYVNFESATPLKAIFDAEISVERIVDSLSIYNKQKVLPGKTLIIFDEVQEVPRALTSLKYFAEEAPEYVICCAGSLLGVALHQGTSFPVGKVDFLTLAPLSFQEFLLANGENLLVESMQKSLGGQEAFADKLTEYLKSYFCVGGMPAAVQKWIDTHDYYAVEKIQRQLLISYEDDFSKHAPRNLIAKIRYVWQSIPAQLAKENKKFIYGLVREGARAREYEDAIMWLNDTGLIRRVHRVTKPALPLNAYTDLQAFKVYLLDIGLLRAMSGLSVQVIIEGNRLFEEFKGSLTEQYALQEMSLFSRITPLCYWTSSSKAEVDFVFSDGINVYPLEVKAGVNVQAKSLKIYAENYSPKQIYRASLLPYTENGNIINLPLYGLFCFQTL